MGDAAVDAFLAATQLRQHVPFALCRAGYAALDPEMRRRRRATDELATLEVQYAQRFETDLRAWAHELLMSFPTDAEAATAITDVRSLTRDGVDVACAVSFIVQKWDATEKTGGATIATFALAKFGRGITDVPVRRSRVRQRLEDRGYRSAARFLTPAIGFGTITFAAKGASAAEVTKLPASAAWFRVILTSLSTLVLPVGCVAYLAQLSGEGPPEHAAQRGADPVGYFTRPAHLDRAGHHSPAQSHSKLSARDEQLATLTSALGRLDDARLLDYLFDEGVRLIMHDEPRVSANHFRDTIVRSRDGVLWLSPTPPSGELGYTCSFSRDDLDLIMLCEPEKPGVVSRAYAGRVVHPCGHVRGVSWMRTTGGVESAFGAWDASGPGCRKEDDPSRLPTAVEHDALWYDLHVPSIATRICDGNPDNVVCDGAWTLAPRMDVDAEELEVPTLDLAWNAAR